ncbi:MAG: hypothetical protein WCD70_12775 [Alphaproteobacteria bacterium]
MRISLIGMSNIGKSTWAKRMAAGKGWKKIDCDALIEKKLAPELAQKGYVGLQGMAAWMGFPFDPQYQANSGLYLSYEQEVMRETLGQLRKDAASSTVIDTTGSVIYTGADILAELRDVTRVVYFEASEEHIEYLYQRYLKHPKPVIWSDKYTPRKGETQEETLKRCYPELLRDRARQYGKIAHMTIPFQQHRNRKADIDALIIDQIGNS